MSRGSSWEQAFNVLCVRLDNMGDVLMTTPAMRALKQARPERRLTLLASRAGAALMPFLPDIDEVIAYDAPWVKHEGHDSVADLGIVRRLRRSQFDAAIIFTVYSQSPLPAALMCRLAGIPLVMAHCRENPYGLLSDWIRETEPGKSIRHEAQRQLDLVGKAGAFHHESRLSFATRSRDRRSLHEKLAARKVALGDRWMVAHCGASAPSRRYPAEYFAEALRRIGNRAGPIMLTGDVSERLLIRQVSRMCGVAVPLVDVAGDLSLGEFACLVEDAALLLSNNTGPVHLAAALGTPVVDLYALTNPQHTPWRVPHRVLYHDVPCKYCYRSVCPEAHHACLRGVSPETVCEAVLDLLNETRPSSPRQFAGSDCEALCKSHCKPHLELENGAC